MFSSKECYKRINKIHEKSLRLVLNDYESSFDSSFSALNETRKTIGSFKSLQLNCSDITQVNTKMRNVNYC